MNRPKSNNIEVELEALTKSVNPVRLKNNPVTLTDDVMHHIYERILL
jgi:hypothetical protein